MTNHRLFIPLFICFGLTSLYTSSEFTPDDIESRGTLVEKSTVINKDFKIEFYDQAGFTISSNSELTQELMLSIAKQVAIRLGGSQGLKAYGTFEESKKIPATDVGGAGSGIGSVGVVSTGAETTDPKSECCFLWCIPMCLRNCLKRLFCC